MINGDERNELRTEGKGSRKWILLCVPVVIIVAAIIGISIYNAPANRLSRQLDLGQKYLVEKNYEQAIVEFDKAIAIDPMNVEAYLGKADACVGMGDYENAIAALQKGYELTGDERLQALMAEIQGEIAEREAAEGNQSPNSTEYRFEGLALRIADIHFEGKVYQYLTLAERQKLYAPLITELEAYINWMLSEKILDDRFYTEKWVEDADYITLNYACRQLGAMYLDLGDEMACLKARATWADYSGDTSFIKDGYIVRGEGYENVYDRYGRPIEVISGEGTYKYTYQSGWRVAAIISDINRPETGDLHEEISVEYDNDGRTIGASELHITGGFSESYHVTFQYMDASHVCETREDTGEQFIVEFDVYGNYING